MTAKMRKNAKIKPITAQTMEIVTPEVRKDMARKFIEGPREGEQDFRGVFGGGNRYMAAVLD